MHNLMESLQLATADPPPTRVDIDALIRAERHRRHWLAAGSGLATVAVVGAGALLLSPAPAGTGPGGVAASASLCTAVLPTPTPVAPANPGKPTKPAAPVREPTEPRAAAVERLSTVLAALLASTLPDKSVSDYVHPACARIQFEPDVYPALYYAGAVVKGDGGYGNLVVAISPAAASSTEDIMSPYENRQTLPDGTVVGRLGGAGHNQVSVLRPDGTYLLLFSNNGNVRPEPPVTVEQLVVIGTDPRLTLYP